MSVETSAPEKETLKRLFLPSLAIAAFSTGISNAIITLLVVDIAITFLGSPSPAAIGAVSQLTTVNAAAEIAFAILLSILVIRFRHKPLLLAGIILMVASALGSFLAPDLLSLQFFLALEGGGSIMVGIIALTLIGDLLPPEKKAKAISYIVSVSYIATLIVILLLGFIANIGGWRYDFLFLALPISVAGLIIAFYIIPSKSRQESVASGENPYLTSFKQILANRSAIACLIASILTVSGTQGVVFVIAFYQTQFAATRAFIVLVSMIAVTVFIVAPLVSGRLVARFGAKPIAISSGLLSAFFTMTFFFIPNLWLAVAFDMLRAWFAAIATTAFLCLILEQVPKSRGTMMSLNSIFNNIGNVIAPALGGALLFMFEFYGVVGLALGALAIAGSAVIFFLVRDPTKTTGTL